MLVCGFDGGKVQAVEQADSRKAQSQPLRVIAELPSRDHATIRWFHSQPKSDLLPRKNTKDTKKGNARNDNVDCPMDDGRDEGRIICCKGAMDGQSKVYA
jgi:hypothetical protein